MIRQKKRLTQATAKSAKKYTRKQPKRIIRKRARVRHIKKKQPEKLTFSSLKRQQTWQTFTKQLFDDFKTKETVFLLVFLILILVFFFNFVGHRVDGKSMAPTFQPNDLILIAKRKEPTRYSMITFSPKDNEKESYVKRVIGLPGDRIKVDQEHLLLLPKENDISPNIDLIENIPDGTIRIALSKIAIQELSGHDRIPEDCYFVEGDNRLNSEDSRMFGLVSKEQIEGVVCFRYFPFSKIGTVD